MAKFSFSSENEYSNLAQKEFAFELVFDKVNKLE